MIYAEIHSAWVSWMKPNTFTGKYIFIEVTYWCEICPLFMVTTQKPYFCWLPEASLEASAAAFLVSNSSLSKLLPLWPSSTSWRASSWSYRGAKHRSAELGMDDADWLIWEKKIHAIHQSAEASVIMTHLC